MLLVLAAAGCGAPQIPPSIPPETPSAITLRHVVFISLKDKADLALLEVACDSKLESIPGVLEYARGRHIDTGRTTVDRDYDLAISVGFSSLAAYRGYLVHPQHIALVGEWKDKFRAMRIYDFGASPSPAPEVP